MVEVAASLAEVAVRAENFFGAYPKTGASGHCPTSHVVDRAMGKIPSAAADVRRALIVWRRENGVLTSAATLAAKIPNVRYCLARRHFLASARSPPEL